MTTEKLQLAHAPIIEAVVDINCDLPPATDLSTLEAPAKQAFARSYPKMRRQVTQRHELKPAAQVAVTQSVSGFQFLSKDEKQVVQIRPEGYSFNRLAPYGSLDDYLPDIESSWNVFRELTRPVQVRGIVLRYINRILLPAEPGGVSLDAYLRVSPMPPEHDTLEFVGFLNQNSAVEVETGNHVNITLVTEPLEGAGLPIIFDIETLDTRVRSPEEWREIREAIESLRRLKNRVFQRTLTPACLNLFQQP